MGEAFYVIDIEIYRDRSQGTLGLSRKAYIERILEKFRMSECKANAMPILRNDIHFKSMFEKCFKNERIEKDSFCNCS